jgi:hypothetical protein
MPKFASSSPSEPCVRGVLNGALPSSRDRLEAETSVGSTESPCGGVGERSVS